MTVLTVMGASVPRCVPVSSKVKKSVCRDLKMEGTQQLPKGCATLTRFTKLCSVFFCFHAELRFPSVCGQWDRRVWRWG